MTKGVEVSAPGKLMLFGEHAVIYGRPCIVTAADQRVRVAAEIADTGLIKIQALDVGVKDYTETIGAAAGSEVPQGARFAAAAVRNFFAKYGISTGVNLRTRSEFSS